MCFVLYVKCNCKVIINVPLGVCALFLMRPDWTILFLLLEVVLYSLVSFYHTKYLKENNLKNRNLFLSLVSITLIEASGYLLMSITGVLKNT